MSDPVFGSILRDARVRRGVSIDDAARSLRIRTDVLQAIENSDFQRMPPRSYARNMIVAYSKLIDISPDEVLKRYDDEFYSFQIGRKRQSSEATYSYRYANTPQPQPKRQTSNRVSQSARATSRANGRDHYEISGYRSEMMRSASDGSETRSGRTHQRNRASQSSHRRSRHSVAPGQDYLNVYSNPSLKPKRRIPSIAIILLAVAVLIALVFLVRMVACSPQGSAQNSQNPAISGLTDPEKSGISTTSGSNTPVLIAPTAAVFSYQVLRDQSAYVEIYVDDRQVAAGTMEGGSHDTYDVTGSLRFDTTAPNAVSLTVGGEKVEPAELESSPGVYRYSVVFSEYLEAWRAAHAEQLNPTQPANDDQAAAAPATSPTIENAVNAILTEEGVDLAKGVTSTSSSGISTTVNR